MAVATRDFRTEITEKSPGYNKPQQMGRRLWAPMWAMAVMAFPIALIVAFVAAGRTDPAEVVAVQNIGTGIMFIGFASVFAAVSFAIARILGAFRRGGGEVQEALGVKIQTLQVPNTARAFVMLMMVAMMGILVASVLHFVVAANVASGSFSLATGEEWMVALEAVRRLGVGLYLFAISLGLATIVTVIRFQTTRLPQIAAERV